MNSSAPKYFKCTQCGKCCRKLGLPYDPDRIHEMAHYLGITIDELIEKCYGNVTITSGKRFWTRDWRKGRPCPFLKEDNTCGIYSVRPNACRAFPTQTDFGDCGVGCPGLKNLRPIHGEYYRD